MEVETVEADSKDLVEILKQATSGDEIIFESDITDDGEEEEVEIVEIIEEIEEVEEADEDEIDEQMSLSLADSEPNESAAVSNVESSEKVSKQFTETNVQISQSRCEYIKTQLKNHFKNENDKDRNKQVVTYDVDEDWEEDDLDQIQQQNSKTAANKGSENDERYLVHNGKKHLSNQNNGNVSQSSKSQNQTSITRYQLNSEENTSEYWDEEEQESIVGYEDEQSCSQNEENQDSQHEIVKNAENNLVYTVLGSKKQNSSSNRSQEARFDTARYARVRSRDLLILK